MPNWRKATQYRNWSEMLRAIADELGRADYKASLLEVADHLDAGAEVLERKAREAFVRA